MPPTCHPNATHMAVGPWRAIAGWYTRPHCSGRNARTVGKVKTNTRKGAYSPLSKHQGTALTSPSPHGSGLSKLDISGNNIGAKQQAKIRQICSKKLIACTL